MLHGTEVKATRAQKSQFTQTAQPADDRFGSKRGESVFSLSATFARIVLQVS